ncbi:MAG: hypothetical protein KF774_16975 [Planctomyces sp.]|nr:hypothetical protein [Planctomyces sp.]
MLDTLLNNLRDHGIKYLMAAAFGAIGWFIGHRRARARWRKREFLDRLNVSLNVLVEGRLLIRTLLEKSCTEVFLNQSAVEAVTSAARRTTEQNPLLQLPVEDAWYYLNAVLNEIAEKFADGQVRRALGQPVQCGRFLVCLTHESAGALKTRKIRALMISKEVLKNLPAETPQFDSPHHITRWKTLQTMQAAYAATPDQFIEVEICV